MLLLSGACATYSGARYYERGSDALDAGDADTAVAHLERAAELVPHASEIHNHLGIAYQAAGRRAEALDAYERAVEVDCDNAAAQRNLSALRVYLGVPAADVAAPSRLADE